MPKKIKILMVDDHPFIIEAYKNTLAGYKNERYVMEIDQASDCKSGYEIIASAADRKENFDVAFLDISMPSYDEKKIFSGEDLAVFIKEKMPDCKVILLTMHTEMLRISNIIKKIQPNGLIIKNDLTFDELLNAFDKIMSGEPYYSKTVFNFINNSLTELTLDEIDREIIHHLSNGVMTKNIPHYVGLSLSAIEKRKLHMKDIFSIIGCNDEELIREAKSRGML